MERKRIVLATSNLGKVREISQLIGDVIELVPFEGELPEETGSTYEENAYIKARAAYEKCNMPALADDSGLEVDYLGGRPGIYSNRFMNLKTDREKYEKLLELLKDVPWEKRTARFRSVVCYIDDDGKDYFFEGVVEGYIATEPKGNNGFGYDPVFYYPPMQKHFAQLSAEEKNTVSHRSKAFLKFKEYYIHTLKNIQSMGGEKHG
jgi:XTP/dITP diphosphohydrolase